MVLASESAPSEKTAPPVFHCDDEVKIINHKELTGEAGIIVVINDENKSGPVMVELPSTRWVRLQYSQVEKVTK